MTYLNRNKKLTTVTEVKEGKEGGDGPRNVGGMNTQEELIRVVPDKR